MKWTRWVSAFLFVAFAAQGDVWAASSGRSFQLHNRLRVEYDDNVFQTEDNTDSSIKIIEELELLANVNMDQTFLSLRYRPIFTWWDDRPGDETDLHHDFDLILNHAFTPRVSISVVETLRIAELPELVDASTVVREKDDYYYNTLNATLGYTLSRDTRLEAAGRYVFLKYDDSTVADTEDYDIYTGGLTIRHALVQETTLSGDLRVETVEYEGPDRGSDSIYVGGTVEHVFNPSLLGSLRAGFQNKDFNDAESGSESAPYGDVTITALPTPQTRISAGAGFSLFETDLQPYVNQDRTRAFLSLSHDVTARIALNLTGSFVHAQYNADQVVSGSMAEDGDEDIVLVSARLTYKVNRNNWLEAGFQFTDLDSDLRESYDRNRINVGWKTKI